MTPGQKPLAQPATAAQLVALFNTADKHPKAMAYEIIRAPRPTLVLLAYGEDGKGHPDAPYDLAEAAYNELERRSVAFAAFRKELARIGAQ